MMNLRFPSVASLVTGIMFLLCACSERTTENKTFSNEKVWKDSIPPMLKNFSQLYPKDLLLDNNSLIFFRSQGYDTSYVVEFKRGQQEISAMFCVVLPEFQRFSNDYAEEKTNLLFFEGYSFIIDSIIWNTVKAHAEKILTGNTISKEKNLVADGVAYGLFYNYKHSYSIAGSDSLYVGMDSLLMNKLLSRFMSKRKPIKTTTK
jgi:hypothetical protein